jgi:hypothetical protein
VSARPAAAQAAEEPAEDEGFDDVEVDDEDEDEGADDEPDEELDAAGFESPPPVEDAPAPFLAAEPPDDEPRLSVR